ncbi:hypothetical protein C8R46DRAFT_1198214 [Mycena filopes]|nr:hypothetical protein C8R46DRAFT_1198214 [Mycena filopes]
MCLLLDTPFLCLHPQVPCQASCVPASTSTMQNLKRANSEPFVSRTLRPPRPRRRSRNFLHRRQSHLRFRALHPRQHRLQSGPWPELLYRHHLRGRIRGLRSARLPYSRSTATDPNVHYEGGVGEVGISNGIFDGRQWNIEVIGNETEELRNGARFEFGVKLGEKLRGGRELDGPRKLVGEREEESEVDAQPEAELPGFIDVGEGKKASDVTEHVV